MLLQFFIQSLPGLLAALTVAGLLALAFVTAQTNRKINKLGGRAKKIPSKFFGIDETYRNMQYAKIHKNRELWQMRTRENGSETLEMKILWERMVFTSDDENIKAVLATQFQDFGRGDDFRSQWNDFLGNSIFTTDGKKWSELRHLLRPQFIRDRVSDLRCFERHTQSMIELIPKDGGVVDMKDLFFRFALDLATDFLMGTNIDSLHSPKVSFAQAFSELQAYQNQVFRLGPLRFLLSTKQRKKNLKILNEFIQPFVERTLQMRPDELKDKSEDDYNLLHALAQFTRDPAVLRDQLVSVLLAARDTTAGTLAWILYELSSRPKVVDRLRREILQHVGPDNAPTYAHLKEMKFVQNVINETLRLYPAVPVNVREALKDTSLPRGAGESGLEPVGVLAGTVIAYSTMAMQRREDLFGPDVNEFKPERWDTWSPKPWQYVPFGGGPRICMGQQFALTEMQYVLVRLFQNFDKIDYHGTEEQYERCEITISPGAGVKVSMRPVVKGNRQAQ